MKKACLALFAFIALDSEFSAQNNPGEHISGFNMVSFTYKLNSPAFAYLELQTRSIEDYSKVDYYEIKGGLGYNFKGGHQPFIGIGRYATYKNSLIYQEELRLWLQYIYSQNLGRFKIDHRLRAEKRFFHASQTGKDTQDERYRYRMNITAPLNQEKMKKGAVFATVFNEIFIGPNEPTLKRNRVFGGLGYQFSQNMNSIVGYMFQREFSQTPIRNLHFFYASANFSFGSSGLSRYTPIQIVD